MIADPLAPDPAPPLIEARGLTKVYDDLVALNDADFRLFPGEVRALIGSNGAGKSTLVKILTGAVVPTSGSVSMAGSVLPLGRPEEMIRRGVACIYQHSNLAPAMTVLDNLFLGRQPTSRLGFLDRKRQRREATALLARYNIELDLDAIVGELPTVKQKEIEIAKALALSARVLLMDEPTAWLAASDVRRLHDTIRALKQRGVGIVYISHMLDEIFTLCDTMTIMRDGRVIAEANVAAMSRTQVVRLMVGDKLAEQSAASSSAERRPHGAGKVCLSVRDLERKGVFREISFDLHAGEILCITGLIGSKRSELMRAIFGADPLTGGSLKIEDRQVALHSPSEAIAAGIGFIPEDRHRDGLMLGMSVRDNLVMATLDQFRGGVFLRRRDIDAASLQSIRELSIHPADGRPMVRLLSGGNQQKVMLGKWLRLRPRVIILDEPTVGVDVGAKAEIYTLLRAERDRGAGVLIVSSDLEEVMTIADRIGIMVAGRLKAIHIAQDMTMGQLAAEIGAEG